VSLSNWYSSFRDTLLFSYSRVDIIKNISLHKDVSASFYRNVDNKLPSDTASHQINNDTECSWWHPGWIWRSWGTHDA